MVEGEDAFLALVTVTHARGLEDFANAAVTLRDLLALAVLFELEMVGGHLGQFLKVLWGSGGEF